MPLIDRPMSGKLGKLVHKQKFFHFINYNIITGIVQLRYISIETKEVTRIGYNGLLFSAFVLR